MQDFVVNTQFGKTVWELYSCNKIDHEFCIQFIVLDRILFNHITVTTRNSHRARDNRRDVPISTHYPECRSKPRKA
ncbi:Uncharacterized protein TCM_039391 [Theobroma cacao]|uniref:Uncharacterized protein n=1 Tax=Theobroma cacao TaxID=3641 RepID=A0A061GR51_THECC|nr:Uncharacterized protein TCM_039391 [Theobroma cacao]